VNPFLDLVRSQPPTNIIEDNVSVQVLLDPGFYRMALSKQLSPGEIVMITYKIEGGIDFYLLEMGIFLENAPINFSLLMFKLNKNELSPKKVEICEKFGCNNFDLSKIFDLNLIEIDLPINIYQGSLNLPFLNMLKLFTISDKVLNEKKHLNLLLTYGNFSYNVEIKALLRYFNIIKMQDKTTGDFFKIAKDRNDLEVLYKKYTKRSYYNLWTYST